MTTKTKTKSVETTADQTQGDATVPTPGAMPSRFADPMRASYNALKLSTKTGNESVATAKTNRFADQIEKTVSLGTLLNSTAFRAHCTANGLKTVTGDKLEKAFKDPVSGLYLPPAIRVEYPSASVMSRAIDIAELHNADRYAEYLASGNALDTIQYVYGLKIIAGIPLRGSDILPAKSKDATTGKLAKIVRKAKTGDGTKTVDTKTVETVTVPEYGRIEIGATVESLTAIAADRVYNLDKLDPATLVKLQRQVTAMVILARGVETVETDDGLLVPEPV